MFYETETNDHGLAHDPFKALVSPRPIGWIGTVGTDGTHNLAPYSFFNAIGDNPKLVMFASDGVKDSVTNATASREFTASLASLNLAEQMNRSSVDAPAHEDEFAYAGLTAEMGRCVDAPFVREAFSALECKVINIFRPNTLDGTPSGYTLVIGQVVGIHIDAAIIKNGKIDMRTAAPLARLGYRDYCDGSKTFEMIRPQWEG
jgi:flavin reductase (DIM6/NTAB) family NADH-FMN oxidoreductase RutF